MCSEVFMRNLLRLVISGLLLVVGCRLPENKGQNLLIFKIHNDVKSEYATTIQIKDIHSGKLFTSSWVDYYKKYCILQGVPKGDYCITNVTYMQGNYSSWIEFNGNELQLSVTGNSIQYFGEYFVSKPKIRKAETERENGNLSQLTDFFNNKFKSKGWHFDSKDCFTPLNFISD
jgi:hypothetical protein